MKIAYTFLIASLMSVNLIACGHSADRYEPIADGAKNLSYNDDLSACQQLAQQRSYLNDDVKSNAVAGAVIGGILGAADDDASPVAGAVIGAVAGAAGKSWQARDDRKKVVIQCMKGRGHNVVG